MNRIDLQYSGEKTDFVSMQHCVQSTIDCIKTIVANAIIEGKVDSALLHSSLASVVHASARCQQEYEEVRNGDESLPDVWTSVAYRDKPEQDSL